MQILDGTILISNPFLKEQPFQRAVILLCEHNHNGSFGFIINKPLLQENNITTINGNSNFIVHYGGPVQEETLHFIHSRPDMIGGGVHIWDGIYWGGNYQEAMDLVDNNTITSTEIKFMLGYCGWDKGQLTNECRNKDWIIGEGKKHLLFHEKASDIWSLSLSALGDEYKMLKNYPLDPRLN